MDRKTALVVIIATIITIIVMVYLLIKFGIIPHKTATTTTTSTTTMKSPTTTSTTTMKSPTTTSASSSQATSPSSSSNVTMYVQVLYHTIYEPEYEIINGSIDLPSQAGTTINILQCTNIYIEGSANPNQQVTLTIYGSSGGVVYTTTTTANSYGYFEIDLYSSQLSSFLSPNAQYKFVFSLGQNYYFYATVVQSVVAPCPGNRPIVIVEYTYNGQTNTITLPSQGGTTIQFDYGTDLYIYGYLQSGEPLPPGYSIGAGIFPAGSNTPVAWATTNFVNAFGWFKMVFSTTKLLPGVKYEFVFPFGPDFIFYGTSAQQSSNTPSVYVQYCNNGIFNVLPLPSQAGTTINFTQETNLKIIGYAQPGQQVTLKVYTPWDTVTYSTSATAGSDGSFSMTAPTSYFNPIPPNTQYKFVFSLGQNYYFYATPVQGELCF